MGVLLVMCAGVALGATVYPEALKRANGTLTLACTALLIFSMGATLGGREGFVGELATVGLASLAFCLVPVVFSTIAVYALTRLFMADITARHASERARRSERGAEGEGAGGEARMVAIALGALALGIAYGLSGFALPPVDLLAEHSDLVLYALMFFVGVSVGASRGLVAKLREYHVRAFIVPLGIVAGSVAGGLLCAPIFGMSLAEGGAIASGLGWYSLSGVMLTEIAGATAGSISLLSNLLRELVSFFLIPVIARRLNYPTCIAPAAATSEDTTLPMLVRCTNSETVVLAVVNGIVCSALVPVLIESFHAFM